RPPVRPRGRPARYARALPCDYLETRGNDQTGGAVALPARRRESVSRPTPATPSEFAGRGRAKPFSAVRVAERPCADVSGVVDAQDHPLVAASQHGRVRRLAPERPAPCGPACDGGA